MLVISAINNSHDDWNTNVCNECSINAIKCDQLSWSNRASHCSRSFMAQFLPDINNSMMENSVFSAILYDATKTQYSCSFSIQPNGNRKLMCSFIK